MRRRHTSSVLAALIIAVGAVGGCGSGSAGVPPDTSSAARPTSSEVSATTTPTTTTSSPATSPSEGPTPPATPSAPHTSSSTGSRTSTGPAPSALPARLRGTDWESIPTSRAIVALTFDGGSSDAGVGSVLSTLQAEGIRATFFVTGDFARRFPSQVRRIAAAGHRVGNHSDRHPEYPTLTDVEIRADLARAESAIRSAAGVAAKPLFRFPFGARGAADVRVVNGAGYVPVRWTVDTLGWKGTSGGISASTVVQRVLDSAKPGQIVLMHLGANPDDGTTLDAEALPRIIAGLRAAGYDFVTLDALLR